MARLGLSTLMCLLPHSVVDDDSALDDISGSGFDDEFDDEDDFSSEVGSGDPNEETGSENESGDGDAPPVKKARTE